jgi:two-component system response regulator YesN
MQKVLIVDDELYIREQMRTIVDWRDFDLALVGEAENARAALQFLSKQPVDILITDLSMPGLSDMAYLNILREEFPNLRIVILTMHQEFELIQQALRIGVDDYIAKAQVDRKTFGNILRDILVRLRGLPQGHCCLTPSIDCVYYPDAAGVAGNSATRLDPSFYLYPSDDHHGGVRIHVDGVHNMNYQHILAILHQYTAQVLFYEYREGVDAYAFSAADFSGDDKRLPLPAQLSDMVMNTGWIFDATAIDTINRLLPPSRMTREMVTAFFFKPFMLAAQYTGINPAQYFEKTTAINWWYQWENWLYDIREKNMNLLSRESLARQRVENAARHLRLHYCENISVADMLDLTAMSKSAFSLAFKEYTGATFGDFLKKLRVEQAKKLLLATGLPVASIGDEVGYPDERHFRRVFLDVSGETPNGFRKKAKS